MKNKTNTKANACLMLDKSKGFDNLVIELDDGTQFRVDYTFFNYKLHYKVKKYLEAKGYVKQ